MAKPNPETIRMCAEGLRNQIETNADIEDVEQRERRNAYIALLDCAAFLDSLPPMQPNARSKRRRRQNFHSAQKQRAGVRLTELLGGSHPPVTRWDDNAADLVQQVQETPRACHDAPTVCDAQPAA